MTTYLLKLLDPKDDSIVAELDEGVTSLSAVLAAAGSIDCKVVCGWKSGLGLGVTLVNETIREFATMPYPSRLSDLLHVMRRLWSDEHVVEVDADPWASRESLHNWSFHMRVWNWAEDYAVDNTKFVRTVANVVATMHTDTRVMNLSSTPWRELEFTVDDCHIEGDHSYYDVTPWIEPPRKYQKANSTSDTMRDHLDYVRRMRVAYRIVEGHI
jgi:hypothetical protein